MWSRAGFVKPEDERSIANLDELEDVGSDFEMGEGWDEINVGNL